jgi:death-on-curing protein
MLLFNGYMYCVSDFLHAMENISYHVAAGKIDKDLLRDLIAGTLNDAMDDEMLKLRLLNALTTDGGEVSGPADRQEDEPQ